MDPTKFLPASPGSLVKVQTPDSDWAFVPHKIPRNWSFPGDLYPKLVVARQKLARLDGAGRYMPASSLLLRPLQQREAITSSRLEGTFATAEELLAYGLEPKNPTSQTDPVNSWREVFNHDKALQQGQQLLRKLPLSNRVIKEIHNVLLSGVRGANANPGEFRRHQVHIGSTRRFVPTPPEQIDALMKDLEEYMNEGADTLDPLVRSFLAHYQFETIHPFGDGNGRVGRLLLSLMVHITCELQQPWLYLSPYFEQHKDEYIESLFSVSTNGDWKNWVNICLNATIAETQEAIERIDQLLELKGKYLDKIHASKGANARLVKILDNLLASPMLTIPSVQKAFKITFPTAQADVEKLVAMGILVKSGVNRKPQYYIARQIFAVAYKEKNE